MPDFGSKGFNLATRHTEQWASNVATHGAHCRESCNAAAAHKVKEKSFYIVVAVMSHHHSIETMLAHQLAEPCVAQFAASHFGGNTMLAFVGRYIEVRYNALHAKVAAKSRDKVLIAHRFLAAEVEIAVSHRAAVSKLQHHTQQHHRVGTTAHSHKISLIGRQNVM